MPFNAFLIRWAKKLIESISWPYTFTPTSVRIPVESILIRLMIGCVHPFVTPGRCNFEFNSLMMSFFVNPGRHCDFGFKRMIVSIMLIGELSVAVLALPAFPKTFSTSGTDFIILSCTCRILFTSELETSGNVTGINRMEPSSSGGINSRPRLINIGILMMSASMFTPIVVFLHLMHFLITGSYTLSKPRLIGFVDS